MGVFIKVPQNGWFMKENPTRTDDDWGYPMETPTCIYI